MAENKNKNVNNPTDIKKVNEKAPFQDMTLGNQVYGGGGSREFKTGEWRTQTPVMNWEKCVNCLLCAPFCPDSCIPVVLIMITARAVASVPRSAASRQ